MAVRDDIILRSGIFYFVVVIMALAIVTRIVVLQNFQKGKWAAMGEMYVYKTDDVPANRGDILTYDGRLLASSVPYYSIYMDTRSTGMSSEVWDQGIDGLSSGLSRIIGERSAEGWKSFLVSARKNGERYLLIKRRVSYETLRRLKELPVFREGQYKGGMVAQAENRRIKPNSDLAARTIGYINQGMDRAEVGIEGAFDRELSGINGKVVKQRLTGGDWIPVDDANTIYARDGNDVLSTLDIDIQDVASSALLNQLRKHNADHGCAILMEVATGDIRAITNLELGSDGNYHETYNFAIGESTEPGSTFKLPALMVALEDGVIDTGDIVDTGTGSVRFYNKVIRDTREGGYGKISVKQVFEKSSNVGTSKIINEHYKDNPKAFVDGLFKMDLNQKLNIQLKGEGEPLIRYPGDKLWSGLSLPMMSHGYEIQMTPLQILTFYNAVANDGKMVKPRFVTEIRKNENIVKRFDTEVINASIASKSTIRKARAMLEGVVEYGTATNLRNADYRIAGKTGTAQIANNKYGYRSGVRISYQASFVGYFPAEDPLYSCIVVVNAPSNSVYYGNLVAGPVFKEIADKVYSTRFFRENLIARSEKDAGQVPDIGNGYMDDVDNVFHSLRIRYNRTGKSDWVISRERGDTISVIPVNNQPGLVPDVRGMTLRDAIYMLENYGLRVSYNGRGKVRRQIPEHGARIRTGDRVSLELRM